MSQLLNKYTKNLMEKDFWKLLTTKEMNSSYLYENLLFEKDNDLWRLEYTENVAKKFNQFSMGDETFNFEEVPYKIGLRNIFNPLKMEYMYFSDFQSHLEQGIIKIISKNMYSDMLLVMMYDLEGFNNYLKLNGKKKEVTILGDKYKITNLTNDINYYTEIKLGKKNMLRNILEETTDFGIGNLYNVSYHYTILENLK